jgi:hypothetical protein
VEDGLGGQLRLRRQVVIEVLQGAAEGAHVGSAAQTVVGQQH